MLKSCLFENIFIIDRISNSWNHWMNILIEFFLVSGLNFSLWLCVQIFAENSTSQIHSIIQKCIYFGKNIFSILVCGLLWPKMLPHRSQTDIVSDHEFSSLSYAHFYLIKEPEGGKLTDMLLILHFTGLR